MNEINRLQQLAGILTEIKVNNPEPTLDKLKELMISLLKRNMKVLDNMVDIAKTLGYDPMLPNQSLIDYIEKNPKLISKFYLEFKKIQDSINEIKVNKPDRFSVLKRGLKRVLEGDKEWAEDGDQINQVDDFIDQISKAEDEDELKSILYDYLYNDSEMVQDYMDMAFEKSESPFLK